MLRKSVQSLDSKLEFLTLVFNFGIQLMEFPKVRCFLHVVLTVVSCKKLLIRDSILLAIVKP